MKTIKKRETLIRHEKREFRHLIFNTLSQWGSAKDICELIQ